VLSNNAGEFSVLNCSSCIESGAKNTADKPAIEMVSLTEATGFCFGTMAVMDWVESIFSVACCL
jgi:hypothetical protein